MSALPSPSKSPTFTSTQVTLVLHVPQKVVLNPEPVEMPVHHWPVSNHRPVMSAILSPLKSATFTSTQVMPGPSGAHLVHKEVVNPEPVLIPVHHSPPAAYRPT